jgi:glycine dehydrogenase subunit 1
MPFIPHTQEDIASMLDKIGVDNIESLFDEIPESLRCEALHGISEGMTEMEVSRLMYQRANEDGMPLNFIGAGAYEHHIPAAVWEITTRGEFYSAYTPYQAEASQGTLQLLYEYQTMMAKLTATDVSNASMYDGASALAEAVLMAVRVNRKSKSRTVLVPRSLHPDYRKVVHTIVNKQKITLVEVDFDIKSGVTNLDKLNTFKGQDITAVVVPQPNFFGQFEPIDEMTDWARKNSAVSIAVVNPLSLAILKPPGEWGKEGADIVCGEGQPLGVPLSSGGPYFGFLCCKLAHVRQMPGRIIGRTVDLDGKQGFTLTLQAREQHIRRSKATSNICTNQGLIVTAATIYMSVMGANGMAAAARKSHQNMRKLAKEIKQLPGIEPVFSGEYFHERVFRLPVGVAGYLRTMSAHNIIAGVGLQSCYPELGDSILVCATETKSKADIEKYTNHAKRIVAQSAKCPIQPKM